MQFRYDSTLLMAHLTSNSDDSRIQTIPTNYKKLRTTPEITPDNSGIIPDTPVWFRYDSPHYTFTSWLLSCSLIQLLLPRGNSSNLHTFSTVCDYIVLFLLSKSSWNCKQRALVCDSRCPYSSSYLTCNICKHDLPAREHEPMTDHGIWLCKQFPKAEKYNIWTISVEITNRIIAK